MFAESWSFIRADTRVAAGTAKGIVMCEPVDSDADAPPVLPCAPKSAN